MTKPDLLVSMLLTIMCAAGSGLAALVLIRMRALRWWGRCAVALIGAYAILSFLLGIRARTPYVALLHGESFWSQLPRVLQGAFIGAVVLVPFALLQLLVKTILEKGRTGPAFRSDLRQAIALAVALALGVSGVLLPVASSSGSSGAPTASAAPPPSGLPDQPTATPSLSEPLDRPYQELTQLWTAPPGNPTTHQIATVDAAHAYYHALSEADRIVPRDTFDLDAVAKVSGDDASALHGWVRTHTTFAAYRGTLRGPLGVLMDRYGNSLDRSLLLVAMLRAKGFKARLSHARLNPDLVGRLKSDVSAELPGAMPSRIQADPLIELGQNRGIDPSALRQRLSALDDAYRRVVTNIRVAVAKESATLTSMIDSSAFDKARQAERARDALLDHWWVQWQSGEQWIDLDPALKTSGDSIAAPEETPDPEQVPENQRHELRLRVIVERWDGTQFSEAVPLETVIQPSAVLGKYVELRHVPVGFPSVADPAPVAAVRDAVIGVHGWVPVLTVGDQRIAQSGFTDAADLVAKPGASGPGTPGPPPAGGLLDGLGGESAPGILTAEWLEYELSAPGEPVRRIRREVFDLVGPESREARKAPEVSNELRWVRGLALFGTTEILIQPCQISSAFAAHIGLSRLLANQRLAEELLKTGRQRDMLTELAKLTAGPSTLYSLAAARAEWSTPDAVYIGSINIVSLHTYIHSIGEGFAIGQAFDIVANEVDTNRPDVYRARLEQGVLDTYAEAMIAGDTAAEGNPAGVMTSGATPMERVTDAAGISRLALPGDSRVRIAHDLESGFVVVAPTRTTASSSAHRTGWWRINPRTGDVMGIGDRGWGQALAEYLAVLEGATLTGLGFGVCVPFAALFSGKGVTYRVWLVCTGLAVGGVVALAGFGGIGFLIQMAANGLWLNYAPALDEPMPGMNPPTVNAPI